MENNNKEKQDVKDGEVPIIKTKPMLFFRKYYWKMRNKIFDEIYKLLYDSNNDIVENDIKKGNDIDSHDNFYDIMDLDEKYFEDFFNKQCYNKEIKKEKIEICSKKNDSNESESSEESENRVNEEDSNIVPSSKFLYKTKKIIFQNYIKNYVNNNYKFSNDNFTLDTDGNIIYFCINNYKIFKINYLIQIKINNRKEWICNPYYGLYLLYYVNRYEKPYPIINSNDNNNIIPKTITTYDYFNLLISNDILSFENKQYEVDLNKFIEDSKNHFDFCWMKRSKFKNFLNIQNINNSNKVNYEIIKNLFDESDLAAYNYIFGSKDNICNEKIIELFNEYYYELGNRYLYLDLAYIHNMKTNMELKLYLAFWLVKSFLPNNSEDYEKTYKKLLPLISLDNIDKLLKELIEINNNLYNTRRRQKLFIILNNVNSKYHTIIDFFKEEFISKKNFNFFIFCDIDEGDNANLFFNLYKENKCQLYYLKSSKSKEKINTSDIKKLFPNDNNIECFCDLIKLFNFHYYAEYKKEKIKYEDIIFLKKYLKYINFVFKMNEIDKKTRIEGIEFKSKEIKGEFLKQYKNYSFHFLNNAKNINEILGENEDGIFFEKAIVLDILTEKISNNKNDLNFQILEIKSLFGLKLKKNIDYAKYINSNIIFYQRSKVAEIFDFGIIINGRNGKYMKLYQVSINKSKDDLEKLDSNIVGLHCCNLKKELEVIGEIKNFSFGIITSLSVFNKYLENQNISGEYNLMKETCKKNNYEFLIYDVSKRIVFLEENGKLDNFSLYDFDEHYKLQIPNYNNFFKSNPKLISTKYINKAYKKNINEYLDTNNTKIVGKINYDKKYINTKIEDKGLGLLIYGETKNKEKDFNNNLLQLNEENEVSKKEIIIFKTKDLNEVYEKEIGDDKDNYKISKLNDFKLNIQRGHILLVDIKDNYLIGKKRNPTKLFSDKIISKKKC